MRVLCGAVLFCGPANAQRLAFSPEYQPFYASVAIGVADFEDQYLGVDYKDEGWATEVTVGYRYDWLWSVEGALQLYDDMAEPDVFGSGTERLDLSTTVQAASLRVRLWFPVSELYNLRNQFTAFGFVGVQASELDRTAIETTSLDSFGEEQTKYGLTIGGGVIYRLGKVNLRGSITSTDLDVPMDKGRVVSVAVGIEFNFGGPTKAKKL